MESASTSTAFFDSHPLPHQQFSSRIAFVGNNSNAKINSFLSKKSTRLPPITRSDSSPTSAETIEEKPSTNDSIDESSNSIDPNLRVQQLEKSLTFVKEHCQSILKCLHNELEDLKRKNRDLQFKLIIGGSLSPQTTQTSFNEKVLIMPIIKGLPPQISEHISKMDKEVRRLRFALGETLKTNAVLQKELQKLKKEENKETSDQQIYELTNNSQMPSPLIGEFSDTFREMYSSVKSTKQSAFSLPRIINSSSK